MPSRTDPAHLLQPKRTEMCVIETVQTKMGEGVLEVFHRPPGVLPFSTARTNGRIGIADDFALYGPCLDIFQQSFLGIESLDTIRLSS